MKGWLVSSWLGKVYSALLLSVVLLYSNAAYSCEMTLKVSVAKNWPPYSYLDKDTYKGIDIEILELALSKAKICWQYISYPSSARAFKQLKNEKIDLIFAASWSQERESFAHFSLPYRRESMVLFSHSDGVEQPFDFNSKSTVAINRGSYYGEKFANYINRCEDCVVEVNSTTQRFLLLQNKRIDFSVEDQLTGLYTLAYSNLFNVVKPTNHVIYNNSVHFMTVRNERGELARHRLNQTIKQLDQEIGDIVLRYRNKLERAQRD